MIRAMLTASGAPNKLWGEALITAIYLLNRSSNVKTNGKTPFELYFGHTPYIKHLRIFGCPCYMKEQHKKRSGYQPKLEARASPMIFTGYDGSRRFTYRVCEPATFKVTLTRDVVFDEGKFPLKEANHSVDGSSIISFGEILQNTNYDSETNLPNSPNNTEGETDSDQESAVESKEPDDITTDKETFFTVQFF